MRWDYNVDYRDEFSKGVHRDILIVPHATNVTKVSGAAPSITSKVPVFNASGQPTSEFQDVDWVIDNSLIVKEKFKYSYSLNPNDNISFSCAASAMVQFTFRNEKEYNEETNRWEQQIPNLQYYAFKDNHNNLILGELDGNYIIEVYTYINGDSDTLLYLGMFRVEEDKAVDNGYNRQITAYDFMATFRDMDIFNWYQHLFTGINKLDDDYVDATNKTGQETTKPDKYDDDINWIRKKKSKWTVKDALEDLINNLAAYDMIVYNDDGTVAVGCTNTNPSTYGREYGEGNGSSGLGMPIMLDPQILDPNSKEYYPTEAGEGEYENYGYMKILELEFMENPSIINSGSLSMGKFLEDIGVLAGRYPVIRNDYLYDDDYHDPSSYSAKANKYNNYEKCILTFKPLPSAKNDKNIEKVPEQCFTNHEIVKGFEHSQFSVKDMLVVKIYINGEKEPIEFKQLTKKQKKQDLDSSLQTFSFSGNIFCSYLVTESDQEGIKENVSEYKKIREKLFGKEEKNHNMSSGSLFQQGYDNIRNRNYVPFKLTTFGDPCRDVGDRIKISFTDKITGEEITFYSYIFERTLEGVQKMMDTYETKGQMSCPTFSNYQTGSTYESGFGSDVQMLGYRNTTISGETYNYVTPSDLVLYLRNIGIQLLDEPLEASAKFLLGGMTSNVYNLIWNNSGWEQYTILHDGDTTNPITYRDEDTGEVKTRTAVENDYVTNYWVNGGYNEYYDSENDLGSDKSLHIYTANGTWAYAGLGDYINGSCYDPLVNVVKNCDEIYEGSTQRNIEIASTYIDPYQESEAPTEIGKVDSIHKVYGWSAYYAAMLYPNYSDMGYLDSDITVQARYGTMVDIFNTDEGWYDTYTWIYPGVWAKGMYYEQYPESSQSGTAKFIELKWKDPDDISEWKPTPATWDHTVVVRKEDAAPKHKWDGVEIVDCNVRDKYEETAYKDENIELNKTYYYGFFPYYHAYDKDGHEFNFYRFTKTIRVDTSMTGIAPSIDAITLGVWDGSETEFAWSGSNKMTVTVVNSVITFKMYIGDSVIYSFNATYGTTIDDVSKINMGFIVDDENQIAKPSFVYKNGDNEFSYNQESPTNSQMQDIYSWINADLS